VSYTNYTNIDSHFMRAYEPGDRLVRGWTSELPFVVTPELLMETAEVLFMLHNRDDRPDGQLCPSMSVGDVIVIGETAVSVASFGFEVVQLDANDIINDRTWKEVIA